MDQTTQSSLKLQNYVSRLLFKGHQGFSPWREINHSPPSGAKDMYAWSYTTTHPLPQYVFIV